MSTKLADLAEKLGLDVKDLRDKIAELGFDVSPKSRVIDDEIAELLLDELSESDSSDDEKDRDVADIYDEMIGMEQDREIVKTQRKKTAGRETVKKKTDHTTEAVSDAPIAEFVEIAETIPVKEFAEKTGIKVARIIGELMKNGILANINQVIDFETAQIIADDLGIKLKRIRSVAGAEDFMAGDISNLMKEDDESVLKEKPPVVCVMGHVDHGKTKLLDYIREADVVSGESGGITQHIGAYQVRKKNRLITFLDTPGHEAFTSMRARGAKVTDIAILVVAADEGFKPQTVEAMNHAKEAGVPIIVAINKMDKPNANPDKILGELAEHGLQPEEWGGDTVVAKISAMTGEGIDSLLDMIILSADMLDLKANPDREAVGTVVEAHLDPGLGPIATILVNTGTLKLMDSVVVGETFGRIKLMKDHTGKNVRIAQPATPVLIAGLDRTPKSGDILQVVSNEKVARLKSEEITMLEKERSTERSSSIENVLSSVKSDKCLKLIVKADTKGSLEAIKQSVAKIKGEDVAVKIIHSGVGTITKSDVMMASASHGMIVGFHSDFDTPHVSKNAERDNVEVRKYTVIYDLIEDVKRILSGLLEPEIFEIILGRGEIKQVFLTKKKGMIIGCKVLSGKLKTKSKFRIIRGRTATDEDNVVGIGFIDSLRKVDEVVKEIGEGNECGINYIGEVDLEVGDILEVFEEGSRERTIS